MGYHVVEPESIEPREGLPGTHHYLEDAVELAELSVQLVDAAPGEEFAPYHYHETSDEVFYVLEGTLHVETPEGEHTVDAGEWFAVEPGNPLHPYNPDSAGEHTRAMLVNAKFDDFTMYDPDADGGD